MYTKFSLLLSAWLTLFVVPLITSAVKQEPQIPLQALPQIPPQIQPQVPPQAPIIVDLKCGNDQCTEILSHAKTTITYHAPTNFMLSFKQGVNVEVFGKDTNLNQEFWYVNINGVKGLVPKKFVKEFAMKSAPTVNVIFGELLNQKLNIKPPFLSQLNKKENLPPVDPIKTDPVTAAPSLNDKIVTSKPQPIISEGTTIYADAPEDVSTKNLVNLNSDQSPDIEAQNQINNIQLNNVNTASTSESKEDDDDDENDVEDDEDEESEEKLDIEISLNQNNIEKPVQSVNDLETLTSQKKLDTNENIINQSNFAINNADTPINVLPPKASIHDKEKLKIADDIKIITETLPAVTDLPPDKSLLEKTGETVMKNVENTNNNQDKLSPEIKKTENIINQPNSIVNNNDPLPNLIPKTDTKNVENNIQLEESFKKTENIINQPNSVVNNIDPLPNLILITDTKIVENNMKLEESSEMKENETITSEPSSVINNTDTLPNTSSPDTLVDDKKINENQNNANVETVKNDNDKKIVDNTNIISDQGSDIQNTQSNSNKNILKTEDIATIPEINNIVLNETVSHDIITNNNENISMQVNNTTIPESNNDSVIASGQNVETYKNEIDLSEINNMSNSDLVESVTSKNDKIEDKSEVPTSNQLTENLTSESFNNTSGENSKNSFDDQMNSTVTESAQTENVISDPYHITTNKMDQPIVTNWFPSFNNIKPEEPIINPLDTPEVPAIPKYYDAVDTYKDVESSTQPLGTFDIPNDKIPEETTEFMKHFEEVTPDEGENNDAQDSFLENVKNSVYSLYTSIIETIQNVQLYKTETSIDENTIDGNYASSVFPDSQSSSDMKLPWNINDLSTDFIFWIIVSAISVLIFTLGYYYLENKKQDKKLLGMINSLQKELMCSSKETIILKEELSLTKEKLMGIEDSSFGTDEMVNCLKKELAETQQTVAELQEKLIAAEEELVNSAEAALELKTIFDEQMSSRDAGSNTLSFTVSNLQSQLDDQQTTMNLIKTQLAAKIEENGILTLSMNEISQQKLILETEIQQLHLKIKSISEESENKNIQIKELTHNVEKSLQQAENQKESELNELHLQLNKLRDELNESKVLLKTQNEKNLSLQESLKLLKIDENNVNKILDVSDTMGSLEKAISEKNVLIETLEREKQYVSELSKKVDNQNKDLINMKDRLNDAEQQALQAASRLEVLTNYFNQKEADLLKELNAKETQWHMRQGETITTVEKIKNLQEEVQQYKDTTESIKRELAEQEASWKAKVATLERRSHEQWLARRAAERLAEAASKEAQTLRQRLAAPSPDKRVVSPVNSVEITPDTSLLSPLPGIGGILPPPMGFLPPPFGGPMILPPPLPPLHRPAPLGRLSSPPPPAMHSTRYSSDSRYSPDRTSNPDTRRSTPQHNMRSYSPRNYRREPHNSRYNDDRYYDSEDDHQSRHYDETETDMSPPPSPRVRQSVPRNHKGTSSGSGQSSESLERVSKRSGKY